MFIDSRAYKSFPSNWCLVLFLLFGITKQLLTGLLVDSADFDPSGELLHSGVALRK